MWLAGLNVQIAVYELPELEGRFLHPGMYFPFALKFTVPAIPVAEVIVAFWRKTKAAAPRLSEIEVLVFGV